MFSCQELLLNIKADSRSYPGKWFPKTIQPSLPTKNKIPNWVCKTLKLPQNHKFPGLSSVMGLSHIPKKWEYFTPPCQRGPDHRKGGRSTGLHNFPKTIELDIPYPPQTCKRHIIISSIFTHQLHVVHRFQYLWFVVCSKQTAGRWAKPRVYIQWIRTMGALLHTKSSPNRLHIS